MTHVRTGVNDLGGDFGFGPDSDTLVLGEFLDELLLGECPGLVVDLESALLCETCPIAGSSPLASHASFDPVVHSTRSFK